LGVFRAKGTILGSTSRTVNPTIYLIVGGIAVAVAAFAVTSQIPTARSAIVFESE
jgi:hypothetical protein